MKRCCILLLVSCLSVTPLCAQQPASQDVPQADRAYRDINTIQHAGIVIYTRDGNGRRSANRVEFAIAINRLLLYLDGVNGSHELADRLRFDLPALAALGHLVREFAPELQALGQDVPAVQAQITSLAAGRSLTVALPFPDVPKRHWAYASVEALRKAGIVDGEPGGRLTVP